MFDLNRRIEVRHQNKGGGGLYRLLRCSVLLIWSRTKQLYICVTGGPLKTASAHRPAARAPPELLLTTTVKPTDWKGGGR